jgi:cyclophilin family peptidyl-prolyl cis-trans isomerase
MRKRPNFSLVAKELAVSGIDLDQEIRRILTAYPMPVDPKPGYGHPIDWDVVARLSSKQKVAIRTTKGDLFVQLNVNWCPATCAAFVGLIEEGFYRNLQIHRVVPNFVVQDGCPRGDGWGGPEWTIRSEFTPTPFMEGTLGMASSGKDTEGSQWYLTHSPTPHLDGKYTNFGFVVAGMEVVHQLEVGDVILGMELLKE